MEVDEPMTPAGRLFVQPLMDQVINCAIGGELPIHLDSIKSEIQSSILLQHPRFCSLMVTDSSGRHYWRRTEIDVDRHVIIRRQPLSNDPSVSDEDAVNDYVANLTVSSPLSPDKPLWEIHVLAAHRTVVFRVHHALGDGISLMSMLLTCCRRLEDPLKTPTIAGVGASSVLPKQWSVRMILKSIWFTLVNVLEFILRVAWVRDKTTTLSGGAGVELWPRRLATARFSIEDMKIVRRAVPESTINDVLFGLISLGFSRYLDITSDNALQEGGDQITGIAMVNLRPQPGLQDLSKLMMMNGAAAGWGNRFGILLLPVSYFHPRSHPLHFVHRAKAMIDTKKLSFEAPFSHFLMQLITSLFGPKLTSILNYRLVCNTTFTVSNIVGPREKITLVGNPVKYMRVTSSSMPHAITMHMMSYAGIADMQILAAKEVVPDPKVLAKCFEDALSEMKESALQLFK